MKKTRIASFLFAALLSTVGCVGGNSITALDVPESVYCVVEIDTSTNTWTQVCRDRWGNVVDDLLVIS